MVVIAKGTHVLFIKYIDVGGQQMEEAVGRHRVTRGAVVPHREIDHDIPFVGRYRLQARDRAQGPQSD